MLVTGWLSSLKDRSRSQRRARRRDLVLQSWIRDAFLEDRCLLSGIVMPCNTVATDIGVSGVLYDGVTGQFVKQITITNNSTQTIYPFLEDANSRTAITGDPSPSTNYTGTGMFDPFDPLNQEYRGYIGYTQQVNGQTVTYAGLQPGTSITIDVPLVFWDAGRIIITTDGADLFGTGANGNPFLYRDKSTQVTYYGTVTGSTLTFTPVYNSFTYNSANNDYEPSTASWKPPTDLKTGMYVNGPGIPGNTTITVGSDPDSITLNVPQGTSITTSSEVQQFTFTTTSNSPVSPSLRYTQTDYTVTNLASSASADNGVVMWYHALTAENPNNDAPFQLIEMSFRGTFYNPTINTKTGFNYLIGFDTPTENYISANDFNLVNYDVSYVDSFALPVAMEADSVPIPNTQPAESAPFGWVGSSQTIDQVQAAFESFIGSSSSLGSYFGGPGYPSYYAPSGVDTIKLPSGQNLFFQSPFSTGSNLSSFADQQTFADGSTVNFPLYALTDGGSGPFSIPAGGATDPNIPDPTTTQLVLAHTTDADKYKLQLLASALSDEKFAVTSSENGAIPAGTVITSMLTDPVTGQIVGVNLSQPISSANPSQYVYTFARPTTDPIATAIASLWYSWANYYAKTVQPAPATNVPGSLASNILALTDPTFGLVPGMAVTDAQGGSHGVITAIASDNKTITLSQASPGALADHFNFTAPSVASITGYDPTGLTPIKTLTFNAAQQAYALEFAQNVYVVMSTMSPTVKPGTANASIPLLGNVIGGNVGPGYLPNENAAIQAAITNQIKSALRGVPDFTSPLYSNPSQWYPDPALPAGGQSFNVYNLDPFIWFIHQKLGLSAYAFALDDDIGDVGAGGATKLDVSVGGLGGLPNQSPFANTANYGPVQGTVTHAPPVGSSVIAGLPLMVVNEIAAANFSNNTPGRWSTAPACPSARRS